MNDAYTRGEKGCWKDPKNVIRTNTNEIQELLKSGKIYLAFENVESQDIIGHVMLDTEF